jgi:hypothetical protein
MPKPLSPEQLESLQANGVVIPGMEPANATSETDPSNLSTAEDTMPAGLVLRTLGSVGLPHSETIGRIDPETGDFTGSLESLSNPGLVESYRSTHETVSRIMSVVGETLPDPASGDLVSQLERLKPTFEALQRHGLEPEIALTPAQRELTMKLKTTGLA